MPVPDSFRQSMDAHLGKAVVIDTDTRYVYLGVLENIEDFFITLSDADVHDMEESSVSRELYVLEARRHGIQRARHRVFVKMDHIVSLSLLDDVIQY